MSKSNLSAVETPMDNTLQSAAITSASSAVESSVTNKSEQAENLLRQVARDYAPAVFSTSLGAEDMVVLDLILRAGIDIEVFTLDTGRLPPETYDLLAEVERHYQRKLRVYYPPQDALESYVGTHGINAFYDGIELRKACCEVRKVAPLRRALAGKRAWVTGLRADQAVTRGGLKHLSYDAGFDLVKISPLADWSEQEVWAYIRRHAVPYNALHDRGYPSIGCAPCTRAVAPGEDVRAGRWWWEAPEHKECGLHVVNGRLQRITS